MNRRLLAAIVAALLAPEAVVTAQQSPATIQLPENLVAQGIPPIPASLAATVRKYTEARSASLADWHPTRREILLSTRFGNAAQLHRVGAPMGARYQLTFYDEPVTGGSFDPRDGQFLIFSRDVGGNEFGQLYRFDLQSREAVLLTDGGRSQNGGVEWSTAGDRIAYASTRRNGTDRDIYTMDPRIPSTDRRVLQVSGGGWSALDWSPDDRTLLVGEYLSVNDSRLWLVDVASGAKRLLTPAASGDPVAWSGGEFSADGRAVFATADAGSEFQALMKVDVASGRVTPVVSGIPWDIDAFDLSPDGSTIAFVVNEAGIARLHLLDTATGRHRRVASLPQGQVGGLKWRPGGGELAFSLSASKFPSDVFSLDVPSGKLTRWTESELGGLDPDDLVEPSLIEWTSFDGREISGFYYRPPARFAGKRPVIINIHGGPEGQSRPGFQGRSNYYMNELGVAMIFPNVRGSTGFGKTFVKLDNAAKRLDSVKDIAALLDWIARQPELDASKVLVTGGSYGGYMTLMVATMYDDRICCAVDVVGISNLATFLQNTESYRRDLRRAEYGDEREPALRAWMDSTAALTNVSRITKPLFVVQGANDPRVPRSEAEQIVRAVRGNGGTVWYLLAMDEGHGFRKKNNADVQYYATIQFVRRFLLDDPAVENPR
ncbi:MAG: S9 family peptidase [Gemmatimonadaceae bacterium]